MNVLLIGSGGREHALSLALAKSPLLDRLFVAPGNPGTARVAQNVALDATDFDAVIAFCRVQNIAFVAIGPEQPLVDGLVDALEAAGIKAFGPSKAAARLEGSKGFTKDICAKYHIPTAAYGRFADRDSALAFVREKGAPIVVKADGLAAGKGVVVAMTIDEAERAVDALFAGAFGAAGAEAVIEEYLEGEEASFFALCDGEKALAFASAQDHKRAGDGDVGPNTGGMGAYSPAPVMTPEMSARVMKDIIAPTVAAMKAEGCPFKGVLFAGLMIGKDGPKLIEYNTRFGDPECQVMMARLEDDLLGLLLACADGRLPEAVRLSPKTALTVVLAARGYPGTPHKGGRIGGVEEAEKIPGVSVAHAGTKMENGQLVANGGRVLNVIALADSVADAQALAYRGVAAIDFPDGFYRRDIGWRAIKR
ncbi:phosphoribosylamine--glycine ligase [Rhodoblastus acidophilus]|uniref:Phosphoribosylamine--glycine ligase n=1 Tax=Candidatus Rhodoblastus alkanivorans TaxID=2954117 RepID=A0ABS9Z3K7_9HYPH|nr:phosphoribosylamine--glycine ligase [Candidatus Rhodoblastus alkanivorans]MCI4678778.1 phosphoribosylamine--glycine ligase [Candidatus Rhodoblastus alkanivorans]MCI4682167.1 phosphoribosylamine--glycine ligase [Candidatus Rhodoblastus alkanivorans]MDI4639469.1 phosphoribosylamine--glycine ligase [Rhodoblastus acidophilus]